MLLQRVYVTRAFWLQVYMSLCLKHVTWIFAWSAVWQVQHDRGCLGLNLCVWWGHHEEIVSSKSPKPRGRIVS